MKAAAALDPGRSKCGLVLVNAGERRVLAAGVLPPDRCRKELNDWLQQHPESPVVLGNGTGSQPWQPWLAARTELVLVPEAGTTLAARQRYWQLEPPRRWQRLLPAGLRLPPRDVDDVAAQLLLERYLQVSLLRDSGLQWLAP